MWLCLFAWMLPTAGLAQDGKEDNSEPRVLSVFPSAGQRGKQVRVELRGRHLEGARSVWFDEPGLSARILHLETVSEPVKDREKPKETGTVHLASVELDVGSQARAGVHTLRVVGSRGISDAIRFRVVDGPVFVEASAQHQDPFHSQEVALPALVSGKLGKPGELDYYAFEAKEGQELSFEVLLTGDFNPRLALYHPSASWFSQARLVRALFEQEQSSDLMRVRPNATYKVTRPGRYLLEISSLFGVGSPDSTYVFRIAPSRHETEAGPALPDSWQERTFVRRLDQDWIKALQSRSFGAGGAMPTAAGAGSANRTASLPPRASAEPASALPQTGEVSHSVEREPNDQTAQALEIRIPALIEGRIGKPVDVDHFRFHVEAGQKLAFEIETPSASPPHFNPRLAVIDAQGRQVLSNVHRRVSLFNNNAEREVYLKAVEPKAIHTFAASGEFTLQIRDMTSRYGNDAYAYRVLVRLQVPHVGEVSGPALDRINLVRGKARKVLLTTLLEEGFSGDVAFAFAGLPQGVTVLATGQAMTERAPTDVPENPDDVVPSSAATAFSLLAAPDAVLSSEPAMVQLFCRPVVDGVPGPNLLVRNVPLMVIEAAKPKEKL
ncbi:MAG: hypothetical protein ACKV22_02500 [Bryobacteraceae bacterium]